MQLLVVIFPLIVMLVAAAVIDLRERRIPNRLTLLVAVSGLVQALAWHNGLTNGWQAAAGMIVGLLVNLPLFLLGVRGGGDAKLFAGVGAWVGPWNIIVIFLTATVFAMLVAIVQAAMQKRFKQVAASTATFAVAVIHGNYSTTDDQPEIGASSHTRHVPYAVPILLAVVTLAAIS